MLIFNNTPLIKQEVIRTVSEAPTTKRVRRDWRFQNIRAKNGPRQSSQTESTIPDVTDTTRDSLSTAFREPDIILSDIK